MWRQKMQSKGPLGHNGRVIKGAQNAYKKGQVAARAGLPITVCPYGKSLAAPDQVDFTRRWRKKWIDGYRSVKPEESMPP